MIRALVAVLAVTLMASTPVERGRVIFETGEGESPITARSNEITVPASVFPCASCHGNDGRGKPEGGLTPSDLRHAELTKPYEVTLENGRRRRPYTDALLRRAITMGIDSSGNTLNPLMPRYQLTRADLDTLVAYMHTLGEQAVRGVTDQSIRLGVLLPPGTPSGAVRAAINSWTARANAAGGIYGRTIDLRFATAPESAAGRAAAAEALIAGDQPFALVASYTDSADAAIAEVAKKHNVPILSAFTTTPIPSAGDSPFVRYLGPGLAQQARALARALPATTQRVAILGKLAGAEDAFRDIAKARGFTIAENAGEADAVLVLDGSIPAAAPRRLLYLSGFAPATLFSEPTGSPVSVALPYSPRAPRPAGLEEYARLGLDGTHRASQFLALASMKVFFAAARAAGRDLTATNFLAAVDNLRGLDTGLTPPLAWSTSRRIGWTDVAVVSITADGRVEGEELVDGE